MSVSVFSVNRFRAVSIAAALLALYNIPFLMRSAGLSGKYPWNSSLGSLHWNLGNLFSGWGESGTESYQKGSLFSVANVRKYQSKWEKFDLHVNDAARAHRLEPELLRAVIFVESRFNPSARSPKGAQGLMQLMPGTARDLGVAKPFDPGQNINGGARYLRFLLDQFSGDLELALAGYNAGPAVVRYYKRIPPFRETKDYVRKVIGVYGILKNDSSSRATSGRPT